MQIPVRFYLSPIYTVALLLIIAKLVRSIAISNFETVLTQISLAEQSGLTGKF
jgi:hypothetical protein